MIPNSKEKGITGKSNGLNDIIIARIGMIIISAAKVKISGIINNGLWCIAFSGRFGVVVKSDKNKAENIFESIKKFNDKDIQIAVESSVSYLHKNSDMFIMLSDGSGKNAYPFAACYDGKNLKKLNFDSDSF